MTLLKSSILIKAPSAIVWQRIGGFETWKDWNPFLILHGAKIGEVTPVDINWNGKMIRSKITIAEKCSQKMHWRLVSNDNFFIKEFTACEVVQRTASETEVTCETKFSGIFGSIDKLISGKVIQTGLDAMLGELKKRSESESA
jgi:hypothetical protein